MKGIIYIGIFFFSFQLLASNEIMGFGSNPGNLRMFIHVPQQLVNSRVKVPVVLVLHGCSQTAKIVEKQSGWSDLADKYGFIVVYPEQKKVNNPMGCFRWYDYDDKELDEVKSVYQMLDFTERNYKVDTNRVFIYGLSAGGVMTVHMLIRHPEKFQAGACLAGGPFKMSEDGGMAMLQEMVFMEDQSREEWKRSLKEIDTNQTFPRLILGHGKKDPLVNIQNSFELIDQFSILYHMDALEDSLIMNFEGNPLIEKRIYRDQSGEEKIQFYLIENTGHALPVDPGEGEKQGGKTGMFAVDRDFFSTYYIARDFGLIDD
ncbi:MAG: PHB depolymerase family esterase [Crocinitomicaceae bacterium]|nr:PHB depolymerase family esterase [Crocinitomicaceae bacterium]